MTERDLKLNSISRYSKHSPTFALEEYSHCEVPAGCGGVVLRWRNPNRAIPCTMWLYTNAEDVDFYLDGQSPSSSRPLVEHGEHVLSFRLHKFDPRDGLLMFAGILSQESVPVHIASKRNVKADILSVADGSWKYALNEPSDESWKDVGFDDATWLPMISKPLPKLTPPDSGWYQRRQLEKLKAKGVGIEGVGETGETVWLRKIFTVSHQPK